MKLFYVVGSPYSDYGSFVVCAENEGEAVKMNPFRTGKHSLSDESSRVDDVSKLEVTYIGEAASTVSKGVILPSYDVGWV